MYIMMARINVRCPIALTLRPIAPRRLLIVDHDWASFRTRSYGKRSGRLLQNRLGTYSAYVEILMRINFVDVSNLKLFRGAANVFNALIHEPSKSKIAPVDRYDGPGVRC